ncbi:mucin-5B-like [Bombina bombina]|uniref:mucin-5B-like n=1 Tax=Bombina bombina TaxID=8345 RepID=UPI00235AA840|nr:mucin-5B-like [Bombina bombina]
MSTTPVYKGSVYEEITGSCCGKCTRNACVFTVDDTTYNLQPGQTFTPPGKPCTTYVCDDNFVLKEKNIVCAPLDLSKCQEGTIITDEDGCCPTCQLKDVCTKFLTNENITFDNCVTETEVEVAYCTGYCDSTSGYSMTLMMENKCSCCQPRKTSMKDCKLTCQNGTTVNHSYTFIEECGCDVLKCVKFSYDLLSTTIKP